MSNPHPDDFVPEDDAIIGKALKGSLAAVIVIAAAAGGIYLMQLEEEQPEVVLEKTVGEIVDKVTDEAVLPAVSFADITESAGIDFVHF